MPDGGVKTSTPPGYYCDVRDHVAQIISVDTKDEPELGGYHLMHWSALPVFGPRADEHAGRFLSYIFAKDED